MFLTQEKIKLYSLAEIKDCVIDIGVLSKVKDNKKVEYYNYPISFDIETTSTEVQTFGQPQKVGIMYIWTLGIGNSIIQGRTWEEFVHACEFLSEWYNLSDKRRLVIYVHSLPFEFQFMHKWFNWVEVFALDKRQPVRALTDLNIEFRCSYKLSGYSLAKLAENLTSHKIKKLVGDLDYKKIRNSKTILSPNELEYCYNDVLIVNYYIDEYLDKVGDITKIPMTKTGEVRNYTRKYCFYGGQTGRDLDTYREYKKLMRELVLDSESYLQLKRAFAGGFTHCNALYSRQIVKNVRSMDFTSSYPYVMVSRKFPMSSPQLVKITSNEQLEKLLNKYCCIFDIELFGVKSTVHYENYLSSSHCRNIKNPIENNGRIVSADHLETTITEQDFFIMKGFYEWDNAIIKNFRIMRKAYLPTNFIIALLDMYESKTILKDVPDKMVEYLLSKERVNSTFGMCVTDICREVIKYSPNDWTSEKPDIDIAVSKNNKSKKRFLFYAWGVWITAYARYNLFTGIAELGDDYVYSDTDSVKFINYERHKKYFDDYNRAVELNLRKAMKAHRLDYERVRPKNAKGEVKQLGVWEDEGVYTRFKTLGAKRYMVEKIKDGAPVISITVSGLNKYKTVPYLQSKYGDKIFENFDDDLYIPPEYTGKMTHTYIDEELHGTIKDYQGHIAEYHEKSCIHLSNAEYSLSLSDMYIKYLLNYQEVEVDE